MRDGNFHGNERETALDALADARKALIHACRDIDDEEAHTSWSNEIPLTFAAMIFDGRWREHAWFEVAFEGRELRSPDPDAYEKVSLAELIDEYRAQCAVSDEIISHHDFDDSGSGLGPPASEASLRWMISSVTSGTAQMCGTLQVGRWLLGKP